MCLFYFSFFFPFEDPLSIATVCAFVCVCVCVCVRANLSVSFESGVYVLKDTDLQGVESGRVTPSTVRYRSICVLALRVRLGGEI